MQRSCYTRFHIALHCDALLMDHHALRLSASRCSENESAGDLSPCVFKSGSAAFDCAILFAAHGLPQQITVLQACGHSTTSTDGLKITRQLGAIAMTGSSAIMPLGRICPSVRSKVDSQRYGRTGTHQHEHMAVSSVALYLSQGHIKLPRKSLFKGLCHTSPTLSQNMQCCR